MYRRHYIALLGTVLIPVAGCTAQGETEEPQDDLNEGDRPRVGPRSVYLLNGDETAYTVQLQVTDEETGNEQYSAIHDLAATGRTEVRDVLATAGRYIVGITLDSGPEAALNWRVTSDTHNEPAFKIANGQIRTEWVVKE